MELFREKENIFISLWNNITWRIKYNFNKISIKDLERSPDISSLIKGNEDINNIKECCKWNKYFGYRYVPKWLKEKLKELNY